MTNDLILQASLLLLAATPVSLIIVLAYTKFFSPYNPNLAKATTILTTVTGNLTYDNLVMKSLIFDKYEAMMDSKNNFTYLENIETREDLKLDRRELRKEETIKLMAITSALCHYPKHQEMEGIMAKFFKSCAIDEKLIRQKHEIITHIHTSEVKKISTIVAINKESEEIFAFNKGNPLNILDRCTRIFLNGKNAELTHHHRRRLKNQILKLNKKGEKAIAFAYKPLPKKHLENYSDQFTENDLVLLGIVGLGNYIKDDLYGIVEEIQKQGIKIYITSHTKGLKALAVGRELNIINPRYFEVISSKELENIPSEKLRKMLTNKEKDYVFSEITSQDKAKILEALREEGETIAIAAKNNSIKTIYRGIRQQQQNLASRPRIFTHAISGSIGKTLLLLAAIILKTPMPLTFAAIIILELLISAPLEFALRKEQNYTEEKHHFHTVSTGLIIGIITTGIFLWQLTRFGWSPMESMDFSGETNAKSITLTLAIFSILQIINTINLKHYTKSSLTNSPITGNIYLTLVIIITILIIYSFSEFQLFGLAPLKAAEWQIVIFAGLILLIVEESRKYISRKNEIHES